MKRILQPEPRTTRKSYIQKPQHPRIQQNKFLHNQIRITPLKIETGRWSRISRENRLCQCNEGIQCEEHVLLKCKQTEHLRTNSEEIKNCANIKELFKCENQSELAKLC